MTIKKTLKIENINVLIYKLYSSGNHIKSCTSPEQFDRRVEWRCLRYNSSAAKCYERAVVWKAQNDVQKENVG